MNIPFSRRTLRFLAACAILAAALGAVLVARAQVLSGGTLFIEAPVFAAGGGGGALTGGTINLVHSIAGGNMATGMSGGTLSLTPGPIGAVPAATPANSFVHAFPVPYRPALGHDRITFRGLTTNATVKVYTLSGELVRTLTKDDPTTADVVWMPVTNSAGQTVASGVYFYYVSGDSGRASGKIMVIR
jgi:hypothetical protein